MTESATVASIIYLIHMTVLVLLCGAGLAFAVCNPDQFISNIQVGR